MFAYTNYTFQPPDTNKTAPQKRIQSPNSERCSSPTGTNSKTAASSSRPVLLRKPQEDLKISERFKNGFYNRQPSPAPRVLPPFITGVNKQRPSSPSMARVKVSRRTPVKERVSERPLVTTSKASVTDNLSNDVIRKRLTEQCLQLNNADRERPKTTERMRNDNLEDKVFHAVKKVLSRAVIEKGKIDLNNINSIFSDMKKRLMDDESMDDNSDDENNIVGVSLKQGQTRVNIDTPLKIKTAPAVKSRLSAGLVRRPERQTLKVSNYKKVYVEGESTLKNGKGKTCLTDDSEKVEYIELPDSDYSKFNFIVKKELEEKAMDKKENIILPVNIDKKHSNKNESNSVSGSKNQNIGDSVLMKEKVGDFHGASESLSWKPEDDVKLQNYIDALVRNMNEEMNGRATNCQELSSRIESGKAICKTFCVCKVCVSNSSTQNQPSVTEISQDIEIQNSNLSSKPQLKAIETKNSFLASKGGKVLKKSLTLNKEENCKVLQKSNNYRPEPKLTSTPRPMRRSIMATDSHTLSSTSYVMVTQAEADEDFYLLRRMKKSPSIRPLSSKV